MIFKEFSKFLEKIENLSSRTEMTEIVSSLVGEISEQEIKESMYLLMGRVTPKFSSLEFNFSTKLILKSLENLDNRVFIQEGNNLDINKMYSEKGDIGVTIETILSDKKQKGKDMNILEVHKRLTELAQLEGVGSQGLKIEKLQSILQLVSSIEGRYIGRIIVGKLRLGMSEKTLLDAFSWYKLGDKSLRKELDRAFGVRADIGEIAEIVKKFDNENLIQELRKLKIKPSIPVASKLVEREKSVENVFDRMGECIVQPKLDGLRTQIHLWVENGKKRVEVFSRNMESLTHMFPDIVEELKNSEIESIIFDAETIGYDRETGAYLPFQETIQRKRKHGVEKTVQEIPVKSLVFDILYYEGRDISAFDLEKRLKILQEVVEDKLRKDSIIQLINIDRIEDLQMLEDKFEEYVSEGLEGIIIKKYSTAYEPGTRNFDWIKLKASINKDLVDTVDGVVMGYYYGTGQRSKFGLGAILIGVYDDKDGNFKSVAKVGTGITDEMFRVIKKDLERIIVNKKPEVYDLSKELKPDVFVEPKIVVEVEADEITKSKIHTAANSEDELGLSLRFPRLIRWNRKKDPEQATSVEELRRMFNLSKIKK